MAPMSAHLLQVQAQIGHLVAVDHHFGLGLVDLEVDDRREGEHAALHRLLLDLLGKLQDLIRLRRGGQNELHRELAAAGQRRGQYRNMRMPGMACSFRCTSGRILKHGALPLVPGFDDHAAEARGGKRHLKGEIGLRHTE